ncbi:hypothetical protein FNV43_RR22587 [Rhamnella rubrinervis]|uniref:BHLH domain-containing protein n=1 Tax=Rhamnella rubrinervis TaxID=2594499 RepID=A0A8K0DWF9_9ROSA|nr:hypothetical protein FNV43_RR22587 [Rhamnella rubrinervis]
MAENERFDRDNLAVTAGTSFSQLLFADDDGALGLDINQTFNYTSAAFSTEKPPKMLCFGSYPYNDEQLVFSETTRTSQISGLTCSDLSSSASSSNRFSANALSKPNKKRNGSDQGSVQYASTISTYTVASQRASKKTKTENHRTSTTPAKRKEKLGEGIAALQQLVSPFGKTDTASVLHEAMGYIKFLQDQVQVLCSPYLQRLPSLPDGEGGENVVGGRARMELRSRGLCLVPVECTVHVENTNGADFWSPALTSNVSLSAKQ